MMLAETTSPPSWPSTIAVLSMCGTGIGLLLSVLVAYFMKVQSDTFKEQTALLRKQASQPTQLAQPVSVTITEELHKVFASKDVFDKHVVENSIRHQQLFDKIEGAKDGASASMEQKVETVRKDVIHIGNQVAGLQVETKAQSTQLNRLETNMTNLPDRVIATLKTTGAI